MRRHTALINEIRGFLLERGITFAAQPIHLRKNLPVVIEDAEQNLSPRLRFYPQNFCDFHKEGFFNSTGLNAKNPLSGGL